MSNYFGHRTKWAGGTKNTSGGDPRSWNHPPPSRPSYNHSGPTIDLTRANWASDRNMPARQSWSGAEARARRHLMMRGLLGRGNVARTIAELALQWMIGEITDPRAPSPDSFVPAGYRLVGDAGPHAPSELFHVYQPQRTGYAAYNTTSAPPYGLHGQGSGITDPLPATAPRWLRWQEGCNRTLTGTWYLRALMERNGSAAETPWPPKYARPVVMPSLALPPPAPATTEKTYTRTRTRQRPRDRPAPYQSPATQVSVPPKGGQPVETPVIHDHLPPGRNIRERKKHLHAGALAKLYGKFTEVADVIDCAIKNIKAPKGKGYRHNKSARYGGLHRKAQYVYNNLDRLDVGGFLSCVAQDNLEDFMVGKANQLANNITKHNTYGRPVGVGSGSYGQRMSRIKPKPRVRRF